MAHAAQPSDFGEAVRRHRVRAGLTQQELARRAGLSVRTLRDIEQSRVARPRAPSVHRLAAALRLSGSDQAQLLGTIWLPARGLDTELRVDVLGPLSVYRDGAAVSLTPSMPRTLLGLLAVQPGQLVSRDQIIDTLWGEHPPRSCASLVQGYATRIRAALEPDRPTGQDRTVLRSTHGGYQLVLNTDQVDVTRFDNLAAAAERDRRAGDDEQALHRYEQALACWRGSVLADAPDRLRRHPAAVAAAQRRITAVLRHADLALAFGRYHQATAQMRPLADDEPLHEGLHARLMLAVAGIGEPAAALHLFQDIRKRLAGELGIEPGPELQAAQRTVLRGEVGTPPAPGDQPTPHDQPPPPAQLPPDNRAFTGRRPQLAYLDSLVATPDHPTAVAVSAVSGTAGVGKSALAVHWSHRVRHRFPDGQLYVNLRGFDPTGSVMAPAEAIHGFLEALHVPAGRMPASLDAQAGLYRTLVTGKRMLVLLDNARDTDQVRPLLPGTPGCLVLITSRNPLASLIAAEAAHALPLDLLAPDEARDLLVRRLGRRRVTAEPDAVDRLVAQCARLPLALAIVAAYAATQPRLSIAALSDRLADTDRRLDVLSTGDNDATDLRAVFSWSYQTLTPPAARLFRALGLHPGPDISAAAAASLAALPVPQVRPLLRELTTAHLIDERTPGRYSFHDLLRNYATDLAHHIDLDDERRVAASRILDHYLHSAYAAARALHPNRDPITLHPAQPGTTPEHITDHQEALAWFNAEHTVLRAVVDHAATTRFDTHTWQLAWTLCDYQDWCGHWHAQVGTGQLALAAAQRTADPSAQAVNHRNLARAYIRLSRFHDAHTQLRHALDLYEQIGDRIGQAHVTHKLSVICGRLRRYADALDHARHAFDQYLVAGHTWGQANALNSIGWFQTLLGDHRQAIVHCRQALAMHRELGDRTGQADAWDSLGHAHHGLGHHAEAITCYQNSLDLNRGLDNRYPEGETLTYLGDVHHATGNHDAARAAYRQALTILDDLEHPDAEQVRTRLRDLDAATAAGSSNPGRG
jgi:DNA-binding SARP family transcriptional activator/DNA-binding XRE family transcriptional regulator